MHRLREYGSRRTERLFEGYERQKNRVRMFTFQQRLRVERQYKVKQRYINKLLESIADTSNPESIEKKVLIFNFVFYLNFRRQRLRPFWIL